MSKINQDLGKAALQGHIEYWQHSLEGIPAVLELPTDRLRPEQHSFAGEMVVVEWDGEFVKGLRELGRRHGATLLMTVLAAWGMVLSRLSGQKEVMIGVSVAGRTPWGLNTEALRVSGQGRVREVLGQVKERVLDAQKH